MLLIATCLRRNCCIWVVSWVFALEANVTGLLCSVLSGVRTQASSTDAIYYRVTEEGLVPTFTAWTLPHSIMLKVSIRRRGRKHADHPSPWFNPPVATVRTHKINLSGVHSGSHFFALSLELGGVDTETSPPIRASAPSFRPQVLLNTCDRPVFHFRM